MGCDSLDHAGSKSTPDLPNGWVYRTLGSCTSDGSISYGVVQPGTPVVQGVPILRVNNFCDGRLDLSDVLKISPAIEEKHSRTRLCGGEVLLTLVGSVGQVAVAPMCVSGFNVARAIGVIRPCSNIDASWIALCLRSPLSQHLLNSVANTTVQTTINLRDLKEILIPIPPVAERESLTELFVLLDARIHLLRETSATLEAIAQVLFKSWFVDFDPVRAKAEGLVCQGMDAVTADLFPNSFEESEFGPIPKGWTVGAIGDSVNIVGGGTPNTKRQDYWSPEEYAWTSPKDLSGASSPVMLHTEKRISAAGLAAISSGLLPSGTLLLSSRAPIGYLAIAQIPVAINQGYIAFLPDSVLPPLFMYFWCKHYMEIIKAHANGSTFMEISKKAFRLIPSIVPPPSIAKEFATAVHILFERLTENERQARTLIAIRDTLLPRLISGKLRLPGFIDDTSRKS